MDPKIVIEKMTADVIDRVLEIQSEVGIGPWSAAGYDEELLNADSICLIARVEKIFVGFMVARLITINNWVDLYNIAVLPKYQRSRIGQTLLDHLLHHPLTLSASRILLEVRASNQKAINFYQKNNFHKIGIRKQYFANPVENGIQMERNLY